MKNIIVLIFLTLFSVQRANCREISLSASMLDNSGNRVNILRAKDIVRFKVCADRDCYIAILCIDARGVKSWLPMTNNFLEAGKARLFPDIAGSVLRVADDGVTGSEQVVIYACSEKAGLPSQTDSGNFVSTDLHTIMRRQRASKAGMVYDTGTFKITYTILK